MNTRPFERLLVPVDLSPVSDKHVELAGKIAKTYGSELILFYSIDSLLLEHAAAGFDPETIVSSLESMALQKLRSYKAMLDDLGVTVEIYDEIPVSDPALAISNAANRSGASEILLVKKGWRVKRFSLIGGTVKELINLASIPIILYHVSYSKESKEVIIHGSPDFARKLVFAVDNNVTEEFIKYVGDIVKVAGTEELIILHVIESSESDEMANELVERIFVKLKDTIASVKRAVLRPGKTGNLIVKFAESIQGSLIVGRTLHKGIVDWLLGSTLDHIVLYSTQPIIIYPVMEIGE